MANSLHRIEKKDNKREVEREVDREREEGRKEGYILLYFFDQHHRAKNTISGKSLDFVYEFLIPF